jgi:hypothetical protein
MIGPSDDWLERMEEALVGATAELRFEMGGHQEVTQARLARGQVLVDWERDDAAGGCLLRPALVRRLLLLNARVHTEGCDVVVQAEPRVIQSLSQQHARLMAGLQPPPSLCLRLRFDGPAGAYTGGEERYEAPSRSGRRARAAPVMLRLTARLLPAQSRPASPQTSTAPS